MKKRFYALCASLVSVIALVAGVSMASISRGSSSCAVDNDGSAINTNMGSASFKSISAGDTHSLAVDSLGGLWAWGGNSNQQIGDQVGNPPAIPFTTTNRVNPVRILPSIAFAQVSAGVTHSAAIDIHGRLYTWGQATDGRLGNGTTSGDVNVPTQITHVFSGVGTTQIGAPRFEKVSAGRQHTLALCEGGHIWAWGAGTNGRLGNGSNTASNRPIRITQVFVNGSTTASTAPLFQDVSAGENQSVAVDASGRLFTWGNSAANQGRLGNGTVTAQTANRPTHIRNVVRSGQVVTAATTETASTVEAAPVFRSAVTSPGAGHSFAIDTQNRLWAWGGSGIHNNAQQGHGLQNTIVPRPVHIIRGNTFQQAAPGYWFSTFLETNGQMWGVGGNAVGQVGAGTDGGGGSSTTGDIHTPTRIQVGTTATQISSGMQHSMAIRTDGSVATWGGNPNGQLGTGTFGANDWATTPTIPDPVETVGTPNTDLRTVGTPGTLLVGDGSAARPYEIPTLAILNDANVRAAMGRSTVDGLHFALTNNITLSGTWTSIPLLADGNVFDGRDHTISNLAVATNGGFFGTLRGTIQNVNFTVTTPSAHQATYGNVGLVANNTGTAAGVGAAANAVIENVIVTFIQALQWSSGNVIAGFVGTVAPNSNLTIRNSETRVPAATPQVIGGSGSIYAGFVGDVLAGTNGMRTEVLIERSINNVSIQAGGISAGFVARSGANTWIQIRDSINYGTIAIWSAGAQAGGFVGQAGGEVTITGCINIGTISAGSPGNGAPFGNGDVVDGGDNYFDNSTTTGSGGAGIGTGLPPGEIDDKEQEVFNIIHDIKHYEVTVPVSNEFYTVQLPASNILNPGAEYTFSIFYTAFGQARYGQRAPVVEITRDTVPTATTETLTATPITGGFSYTLVMGDEDITLVDVSLQLNNYTINVNAAQGAECSIITTGFTPENTSVHGTTYRFAVVGNTVNLSEYIVTVTSANHTITRTLESANRNEYSFTVQTNDTITVSTARRPYNVTLPSTVTGIITSVSGSGASMAWGSEYQFSVTVNANYNQVTPIATFNGGQLLSELPGFSVTQNGNTFTYRFTMPRENVVIAVAPAMNRFNVTLPAISEGITSVSSTSPHLVQGTTYSIERGQPFAFSVEVEVGFQNTRPTVQYRVGAAGTLQTMTAAQVTQSGRVFTYTIPAGAITANVQDLTIAAVRNTYAVAAPSNAGRTDQFTTARGTPATGNIAHAGQFTFTLTLNASRSQLADTPPTITHPNGAVAYTSRNGLVLTYTVTNVTGAITATVGTGGWTVSATPINVYSVATAKGNAETDGWVVGQPFGIANETVISELNHGQDFRFRLTLSDSHSNSNPTVTVANGTLQTPTRSGNIITYRVNNVTGAITADSITVSSVSRNTYAVTLPATNPNGIATLQRGVSPVAHDANYTFSFTLNNEFNKTAPSIIINAGSPINYTDGSNGYTFSGTVTADGRFNGMFTVVLSNITQITNITFGMVRNTYDVTLIQAANGAMLFDIDDTIDGLNIPHGTTIGIGFIGESNQMPVQILINGMPYNTTNPAAGVMYTYHLVVTGDTTVSAEFRPDRNNLFTVTLPSHIGYTIAGGDSVWLGDSYTFSVTLNASYSQSQSTLTAKVAGAAGNLTRLSGQTGLTFTFTVPAADITSAFTIEINGVDLNRYDVTLTEVTAKAPNGVDVQGTIAFSGTNGQNIQHGTDVTVTFTPYSDFDGIYVATQLILFGEGYGVNGRVIELTGNQHTFVVDRELAVEVVFELDLSKRFTVTLPTTREGYTLNEITSTTVWYGHAFEFSITLNVAHSRSTPVVTVGATELNRKVAETGTTWTFTTAAVTDDITIAIDGVEINKYQITLVGSAVGFTTNLPLLDIEHGTADVAFTVTESTGFRLVSAKVGGVIFSFAGGPTYSFIIASVTNDMAVEVEVIQIFDVQLSSAETNFTFAAGENSNDIMDLDSIYTFVVTLDANHNRAEAVVSVNGTRLTNGTNLGGGVWQYSFVVVGDSSITVVPNPNVYTISLPSSVAGVEGIQGAATATYSATVPYTFSVTVRDSHHDLSAESISVTLGSILGDVTLVNVTDNNGLRQFNFSFFAIGDVNVSVTTVIRTYDITVPGFGARVGYSIVSHTATTVNWGGQFEITIDLATGYELLSQNITVSNGTIELKEGTANTYLITGIIHDTAITINATRIIYNVTVGTGGPVGAGQIAIFAQDNTPISVSNGVAQIAHGTTVFIRATVEAGDVDYFLYQIFEDGVASTPNAFVYSVWATANSSLVTVTLERMIIDAKDVMVVFRELPTATVVLNYNYAGARIAVTLASGYAGEPVETRNARLPLNPTNVDTSPTRFGYEFVGWGTSANTPVASARDISVINFGIANSITNLFAVWSPIEYNVFVTDTEGNVPTSPRIFTLAMPSFYSVAVAPEGQMTEWVIVLANGDEVPFAYGNLLNLTGMVTPLFHSMYFTGAGADTLTIRPKFVPGLTLHTFNITVENGSNADGSFNGTATLDGKVNLMTTAFYRTTVDGVATGDDAEFTIEVAAGSRYTVAVTILVDGQPVALDSDKLRFNVDEERVIDITIVFTPRAYSLDFEFIGIVVRGEEPDSNDVFTITNEEGTTDVVRIGETIRVNARPTIDVERDGTTIRHNFAAFQLTNSAGVIWFPPTQGTSVFDFEITEEFLSNYFDGTAVVIQAIYTPVYAVTWTRNDASLLGNVTITYQNSAGNFVRLNSGMLLPGGTIVRIIAAPFASSTMKVSINGDDGFFNFSNSNTHTLTLGEELGNVVIVVNFEEIKFNVVVESPNPVGKVTLGEFAVGDEVTLTAAAIEGNRFVEWLAVDRSGRQILLSDLDGYSFFITTDMVSEFVIDGKLNIIAVFGSRNELVISVSGGGATSGNSFDLYLVDGSTETLFDEVISGPIPFGTDIVVRVVPRPGVSFDFVGYMLNNVRIDYEEGDDIIINMTEFRFLTLIFAPKTYSITINTLAGGNGAFTFDTEQTTFQIGDTIIISFNTGSVHTLDAMFIHGANGQGRVSVKDMTSINGVRFSGNTLTIVVSDTWLAYASDAARGWLDANNNLSLSISAETSVSTLVVVGGGASGALVLAALVAMVMIVISINKKKKDYALARERSAKSEQRLSASSVIGDVLKQAKEDTPTQQPLTGSDSEGGN
jgi:alpha-tubulin suppressor-like RCC1 family protein